MCAAGGRSLIAANLLAAEGYSTLNVSDGFSGNGQDPGWKNLGLPSIINNWFFCYLLNLRYPFSFIFWIFFYNICSPFYHCIAF